MNIGHIFITGLIGTSYKEDGTVEEKGVELLDVVQQLNKLDKDVDQVDVHINSKGGYVSVGDAIAQLISTIPNCFTIAENVCASIATKIHLSVPLQNRFIEQGCDYMIHNPFLSNVTGDAQELKKLADSTQKIEDELESSYSKATGLDKKVISYLMSKTTFLTPEECVNHNFACKVIPKQQARAVALMYNENQNNMKGKYSNRVSAALAVLSGTAQVKNQNINPLNNKERGAKALLIATDKGELETPFEDLMVSDPVLIGGETPENGAYTVSGGEITLIDGSIVSEGTVIEVTDGAISSITPAEASEEGENNADGATDKTDIEALKAKLAELEAKLTASETVNEEITATIEKAAALQSNFVAPRAQANFRTTQKETAQVVSRESMAERKAGYKAKKK